ncbi:butyrophilin subfamily 1 member A1-like isoform X1 [Channa argus]|uniref:butyrophilin subfamily 1 member A1-like isoform X1 n=1 Tax=Channa argus TaxID=215402 RepID=UPI00351FAA35
MMLLSCVLVLVIMAASSSGVHPYKHQLNLSAHIGHDVTLQCQAPTSSPIRAAEWSRPDLEPQYVFFYRDGQPDKTNQHPSFTNRVELPDSQMKGGNLSVILRKVISSDAGTYECRVKQQSTTRKKRAVIKSEPVCIVQLTDIQPEDSAQRSGDGDRKAGDVAMLIFLISACDTLIQVTIGHI